MSDLHPDTDSCGCAFGHDAAMADVSTDSVSTDSFGSWDDVQDTPPCYYFMCDVDWSFLDSLHLALKHTG